MLFHSFFVLQSMKSKRILEISKIKKEKIHKIIIDSCYNKKKNSRKEE